MRTNKILFFLIFILGIIVLSSSTIVYARSSNWVRPLLSFGTCPSGAYLTGIYINGTIICSSVTSVFHGNETTEYFLGSSASGSSGDSSRIITLNNAFITMRESVYADGLRLINQTQYTVSHQSTSSTVTLLNPVWNDMQIVISYYMVDINYSTSNKFTGAYLTGISGASNRVLNLTNTMLSFNEEVYVDGLRLSNMTDYTIDNQPSSSEITFLGKIYNDMTLFVWYSMGENNRTSQYDIGSNLTGASGATSRVLTLNNSAFSRNEKTYSDGLRLTLQTDYSIQNIITNSLVTFNKKIYNDMTLVTDYEELK